MIDAKTSNDTVLNKEWDDLPEQIKGDLIIQVFRELYIVRDHTRLLVLVAHGFIELLVNALIDHHLKNSKKVTSDSRSYPHSTKLLILNELGVLDDEQFIVFDWFRKLRNRAAHQPIFSVTDSDLSKITSDEYRDPQNFYSLCVALIGGFWNQHIPIFGPKYAPEAVGENNNS